MGMAKHTGEDLGVEGVSEGGDEGKKDEEDEVENEKDYGDYTEPVAVVGELMEEDGEDAGRHGDDEPAGWGNIVVNRVCGDSLLVGNLTRV